MVLDKNGTIVHGLGHHHLMVARIRMTDVVKETRRLAKASKIPISVICEAAQIKRRWLFRFIAGDFKDPGANRIARLYDFLKKNSPGSKEITGD